MTPFTVLKELESIYVRERNSNHELRFKIVKKPQDKEPSLLITKVFTKDGVQIETTKLGRIKFNILPLVAERINFSEMYIKNNIYGK